MKYIQALHEGDQIQEVYLCKQVRYAKTKGGKDYMSVILSDRTGDLEGKVWDITSGIESFEAGDFIRVRGDVTVFNNAFQLKISRIQRCAEGEYVLSDYIPTTERDIEQMYQELLSYVNSVKQPHLRTLLAEFFEKDEEFIRAFKRSSAAKSVHHSYVGGLLEHTLGVVENCAFFAKKYKALQYDLVVTAAICHDMGKIYEFSDFPTNDYTDEGNLLGHIVMGSEMLGEKIKDIPDFPIALAGELKHCILAHHGKYEFGSPKLPMLVEAMALHFADNIDAKMETFRELLAGSENGSDEKTSWLGFQKSFESNVRKTTLE